MDLLGAPLSLCQPRSFMQQGHYYILVGGVSLSILWLVYFLCCYTFLDSQRSFLSWFFVGLYYAGTPMDLILAWIIYLLYNLLFQFEFHYMSHSIMIGSLSIKCKVSLSSHGIDTIKCKRSLSTYGIDDQGLHLYTLVKSE